MADSSLTQADKLRALGIRSPDQSIGLDLQLFEDIKEWFKENEDGFSSFEDTANNEGSYSELEQYLVDNNILDAENADQFITKIQNKYSDYKAFTDDLTNYESFDEFINTFNPGSGLTGDTKDSEGNNNQGIRFHSEDGVSRAGVPVPKGTVEIYGPRVEFSQSDPPIDNPEASLSVSNFSVSEQIVNPNEPVTYSASVSNGSGYATTFSIKLYEGDAVAASKSVEFGPTETKTVEFQRIYQTIQTFEASIMDSGTISIAIAPSGISRIVP